MSGFKFHSDANTRDIVKAVRKRAKELKPHLKTPIIVLYIKAVSRTKGVHDILIAWEGVTYMVEIKNAKGVLSDDQQKFHDEWPGGPQAVARTTEEVMVAIGMTEPF